LLNHLYSRYRYYLLVTITIALGTSPMPAHSEIKEVEFRSQGVSLSGTVVLPPDMVAAMVLVHGSGPEERMTGYSQALAAQGIATLTYDKRGVGKSGGIYVGPEAGTNNVSAENLNLLAADAAAAIKELVRLLPRDLRVPVGLTGGSQAGWIIPLAALLSPDTRFMVIWSGPLVTARQQLRFQFYTDGKADFWDHHTEAEARQHIRSDPDRFQFVDTDPRDSLQKLSIPALWLFGGGDINVPVHLCIEHLHALIESGKPYEYKLFPREGHILPQTETIPATVEWIRGAFPQANR
jgi:uncharacterized protein